MQPAAPSSVAALTAVSCGASLGALARWAVSLLLGTTAGGFPWSTLGVNVVGCLLLGLLPAIAAVRERPLLTAALGPGVLGGFTTMSAFAEETRQLLAGGHLAVAASYVLVSVTLGLAALALGDHWASDATGPPLR